MIEKEPASCFETGEAVVGSRGSAAKRLFASRRTMKCLLGTMFTLVVADGVITKSLIQRGLADEFNPILNGIVDKLIFLPIVIAGALIGALLLWDIYRRHPVHDSPGPRYCLLERVLLFHCQLLKRR